MGIQVLPDPRQLHDSIALEYYLAVITLPCDRDTASFRVRIASRYIRESAFWTSILLLLSLGVAIIAIATLMHVRVMLARLVLVMLVFLMAFIASLAFPRAIRLYRVSSELLDLSRAISEGLIEESTYCDKTLYQVYLEYKA